jgi:hypothetical protein
MHKASSFIIAAICTVALVGCGGGSGSPALGAKNPRVRVVNLIQDPARVNVTVNGETVQTNSPYLSVADYRIFPNGDREVVVSDATTGGTLTQSSHLFELGDYYTVINYRTNAGAYQTIYLSDVPDQLFGDQVQLRAANVSGQTVDVYITPEGTPITGLTPTFNDVVSGSSDSTYAAPRAAGSYTVTVTPSDSQTVLWTQNFTVLAGEAQTLVVTGNTDTPIYVLPGKRF